MTDRPNTEAASPDLARVVGVPDAVLMGLGSILGTGIFVSIGIAAGVAGPSVILAVAVAAAVATFNGLSSAQLAANHPVSGGAYEYGYRYLNPWLGFTAGWMFICAKSASAATAALGVAGYVLAAVNAPATSYQIALALATVACLTVVVASGMSRSKRANRVIVALTLAALLGFVGFGLPSALDRAATNMDAFFTGEQGGGAVGFLHATALMFVAYTTADARPLTHRARRRLPPVEDKRYDEHWSTRLVSPCVARPRSDRRTGTGRRPASIREIGQPITFAIE